MQNLGSVVHDSQILAKKTINTTPIVSSLKEKLKTARNRQNIAKIAKIAEIASLTYLSIVSNRSTVTFYTKDDLARKMFPKPRRSTLKVREGGVEPLAL